jgi:maleylacetoacetate isomerase/maleylpyruvate isomerase
MRMKLHNYFRSSSSYRVRIALNLKGLPFDYLPVHLAKGEHLQPPFQSLSPDGLVPVLETEGNRLSQSLAIVEFLEETHPSPALLPSDPWGRARVRALAQTIACEIHPINNLRILKYLTGPLGASEADKLAWIHHWVITGLTAVERMLSESSTGEFCHGDQPGLADLCLVPQVFNAQRFEVPLDAFPQVMRIHDRCQRLPAFAQAHPSRCPDAG